MNLNSRLTALLLIFPLLASAQGSNAQEPSKLTIDRIFRLNHFRADMAPSPQWLADGRSYIETAEEGIVRVDLATQTRQVLAPAARLIGTDGRQIDVEEIILSKDETKALLFHNSERVWRQNTRGYFTILDFKTGKLTPLSTVQVPQMFAKFSPDGSRVGFVRKNNIYVFDIATGAERQLTADGTENIINGTSDWVYEEEFDLQDGFRWSPDSRRIAFFRFDQTQVPLWTMVDEINSVYPSEFKFKYPKPGATNSNVKVGVVDVTTGATVWMKKEADNMSYIPRIGWIGSDSVSILYLPRKQNRQDYIIASAADGGTRTIISDTDSAYVNIQEPVWLKNGRGGGGSSQFIWASDKSGWRQYYLYDRSGKLINQITRNGSDVTDLVAVDEARGLVYAQHAAPEAHQRQIFRYSLNGKHMERLTNRAGVHSWNVAPGANYVIESSSSINVPPMVTVRELPSMRTVRVIADNMRLKARIDTLNLAAAEFFKVPAADGKTMLDAYRIVPANFDSTKKHPVMMFAYGGPAAPQVMDQWSGGSYLFRQMLAQNGYVVVVVDNRGSAWRGRDFRKATQYRLGILESDDQIAAAKWIGRQSWGGRQAYRAPRPQLWRIPHRNVSVARRRRVQARHQWRACD